MHDADVLLGEKIDKLADRFEAFETVVEPMAKIMPKLEQLVGAFDSVMFGRKFLTGFAILVSSIAAIGGSFYAFISWIRHG